MLKQVSQSPALLAATLCLVFVCATPHTLAQGPADSPATDTPAAGTPSAVLPPLPADKYLWLEDTNSPRAMDWVKAEDARSLKVLEADPHYAAFYADALKIAVAPDRLPEPEQRGS